MISKDEIWIKLGGDAGGKSFKQMLQVGNVNYPNALKNTIVICAFEATDSVHNLKVGLERHSAEVLELLQTSWRYLTIHILNSKLCIVMCMPCVIFKMLHFLKPCL